MADIDLTFIAQQLKEVLVEVRSLREDVRMLRSMRDEVRSICNAVARLEDTITMDIMDRLRTLETK